MQNKILSQDSNQKKMEEEGGKEGKEGMKEEKGKRQLILDPTKEMPIFFVFCFTASHLDLFGC